MKREIRGKGSQLEAREVNQIGPLEDQQILPLEDQQMLHCLSLTMPLAPRMV